MEPLWFSDSQGADDMVEMFSQASVAVVDDEEKDMNDIRTCLDALKLPHLLVPYDPVAPDIPKAPFLRLVFMDLNLGGDAVTPQTQASRVGDVLRKLDVQGPWFLVIWSQTASHEPEVVHLLRERFKDIPVFIGHATMDKATFRLPDRESGEYKKAVENLRMKITTIFTESPQIIALMAWESRIASAAGKTLAGICGLMPTAALGSLLGALAIEAAGKEVAKTHPAVAVED